MKQKTLLTQFIVLSLSLVVITAYADPPRTSSVTCIGGGLAAPPKFTEILPGGAEYSSRGAAPQR